MPKTQVFGMYISSLGPREQKVTGEFNFIPSVTFSDSNRRHKLYFNLHREIDTA